MIIRHVVLDTGALDGLNRNICWCWVLQLDI